MSSYLWRYYLDNDAERFQRLLSGSNPSSLLHDAEFCGGGLAVTVISGSSKQRQTPNDVKQRPGSPPGNIVLTRQALGGLDTLGRNVLHLACSTLDGSGLPFVNALLSHPLIDPGVPDLESGWTPLHRALYHGNISAARAVLSANPSCRFLAKAKDNAGDNPFEVFEASIGDIEKLSISLPRKSATDFPRLEEMSEDSLASLNPTRDDGDELFAFGSNMNLTLGFPDGDDRSYPERVPIKRPRQPLTELMDLRVRPFGMLGNDRPTARALFHPLYVTDVRLSKLHTAVLTADPYYNLYICGFGRGGRLGLGCAQLTQFTLRPLLPPLLPPRRVLNVALGLDHTIVVLENGDVWTWGSNKWGQLGYLVQQKPAKEEPIQTTPRQVLGLLKREVAIGCAASNIHSIVYTEESLFTFGKNDGQMGILDSLDAVYTLPRKVAAGVLGNERILQVAAIDQATAVLTKSHEVWILAGHGSYRLLLPIERGMGLSSKNPFTTSKVTRKITGGGHTLCALSLIGDVFTLNVETFLKDRAARGSQTGRATATGMWSMGKKHMAARDVDVGQDGSIIVCTESGSVWRRISGSKIKEGREGGSPKFERVPGLTRIVVVRSNTFGAYAAIRRDSVVMKTGLSVSNPTVADDLANLLAFAGVFTMRGRRSSAREKGHDGDKQSQMPSRHDEAVAWLTDGKAERDLKEYLTQLELSSDEGEWDVMVSTKTRPDIEIPAHRVLIAARVPLLGNLLAEGCGGAKDFAELLPPSPGKGVVRLVFRDIGFLTLINFLYIVYANKWIDIWRLGKHSFKIKQYSARKEFLDFMFQMNPRLHDIALQGPGYSLLGEFHMELTPTEEARPYHIGLERFADMTIELADKAKLLVHSAVMRARCPFFEALYVGGAGGRWLVGRRKDGVVNVDMKHVRLEVMEIVLHWLYHDWDVSGLRDITAGQESGDVWEYLDFILDVMSVANELLLGRLCQICQVALGEQVNTRNAAQLLTAISPCSETGFKDMCMQYICTNMETMLENHLLDELDDDLMIELDNVVKANQQKLSPNSRSGQQEKRLLEKYPQMAEAAVEERQALIASYHHPEEHDGAPLSSSLRGSRPRSYSELPITSGSPQSHKAGKKESKGWVKVAGDDPILGVDCESLEAGLASGAPMVARSSISATPPGNVRTPHGPVLGGGHPSPVSNTPRTPERAVDLKGKSVAPHPPTPGSPHVENSTPRQPESPLIATSSPNASQSPWGTLPAIEGDKKLDMKEIMAQASSSRISTLTTALSSEGKLTPAKVSQKERKSRAVAAAAVATPSPAVAAPNSPSPTPSKAPWATTNTGTRVNLKELLATEPSPPSSTNARAMGAPKQRSPGAPAQPELTPPLRTPIRPFLTAPPRPTSAFATPGPPLQLSLADIISQEEARKEILREYAVKRSLQDIQTEQEFLRWWDSEAERLRLETERAAGRGGGRTTNRKGRRRGGSRGRGQGASGGEGSLYRL